MRWHLGLTVSFALAACAAPPPPRDSGLADSSASDGAGMDASEPEDAGPVDVQVADRPPVRPPPIERTQPDSVLAERRRGCAFRAGAWPAETLGMDVPIGEQIPIDHVLILMQENRSFDHYFSRLPEAGQTDVDVPAADWTNPAADGARVSRYHDTEYCIEDVSHSWNGSHRQYNNGMMDGFVTTNDPNGRRALGYLDQSDLPFYYELANTFAIGDRYFCSLLGPTFPNRLYLMAATSFGLGANTLVEESQREPATHIFNRLDNAQVEWRDYAGGFRMLSMFSYYGISRAATRTRLRSLEQLMSDLSAGTLPPVAFIEPSYVGNGGDRYDEHPPALPQMGAQFVERVVRAVMASPAWRRTALFILYDEHGGFADHVAPPEACPPDDRAPVDASGRALAGRFDRLGFRVPFIVVSPYAKRHFVSHTVYDHSSVARFIEARFGLPAMTARDANATPPMDVFDFASPPFVTPPTITARTVVDESLRARCRAAFPSVGGL
ncbi:MAG: alkaline phosphatase family protein [Myxococcales bacterium]|nr:alkaline phosphatase family protein [Myxococcales bacterium]